MRRPLRLDVAQPNGEMSVATACGLIGIEHRLPLDRNHGKRSREEAEGCHVLAEE
jgi:hypothetical protein